MTEWIGQQPGCTHVAGVVRAQVAGTGGGVVQDDDGVRLAQPKQLRCEQAYDLGFAAAGAGSAGHDCHRWAADALTSLRVPNAHALAARGLRVTPPAALERLGGHAHTQCETCATKARVPDL